VNEMVKKKEKNIISEENKIEDIVVKENKIEKLSPEKWARIYKLDSDLFRWWTDKQILITKEEFEDIKKQIYGE